LKTFGKQVFLFGSDYSVSRDVAQYFQGPFEKKGGQVVGSFFSPLNTTEFAPYLAKIQSANPKPKALFGLLSRFTPWRIGKTSDRCGDCRICEEYCEGACRPSGTIIVSECVMCLNCLDRCPAGRACA